MIITISMPISQFLLIIIYSVYHSFLLVLCTIKGTVSRLDACTGYNVRPFDCIFLRNNRKRADDSCGKFAFENFAIIRENVQ